MKCEICGIRDAVVFVQQVTATRTIELHLCLDCARARGISASGANDSNVEVSLGNLLSGLLQDAVNNFSSQNATCPVCGQTLSALRRLKAAGCPECYTVFKSEIFSALKASGLEGTYHGALPKKLAHFRSVLTDRMLLQSKMADAVAVEDYEKAAVYRDRLKALETRSAELGDFAGDDNE